MRTLFRFTEFKGYRKEDFPAAMTFIRHMFNQQKKEVEASPNYQGEIFTLRKTM